MIADILSSSYISMAKSDRHIHSGQDEKFSNLSVVSGRIVSALNYNAADGTLNFTIKNQSGQFHVKVHKYEHIKLCESLNLDDAITIIASSHSFISKNCRSHHHYYKVLQFIPHAPGNELQNMLTILGAQAFLRETHTD